MGTRADFYVGQGRNAEWIGSIAFDGYPSGIDSEVLHASTESEYRFAVQEMFKRLDHATLPEHGWPWPWEDSGTTDYAYTFTPWLPDLETGCVWHTIGYPLQYWWRATLPEPDEEAINYREIIDRLEVARHPDMSAKKNVRWDRGSGLMVISR